MEFDPYLSDKVLKLTVCLLLFFSDVIKIVSWANTAKVRETSFPTLLQFQCGIRMALRTGRKPRKADQPTSNNVHLKSPIDSGSDES